MSFEQVEVETIYVGVKTLVHGQILIGEQGGLSIVFSVLGVHPMVGVMVDTEHGILCFPTDSYVEIVVE